MESVALKRSADRINLCFPIHTGMSGEVQKSACVERVREK